MLPSWYVMPGNEERKAGGESSLRWIGITPQAPWTKNCMKNPEAERLGSEVGRIQAGMRHALMSAAPTIARRRPMNCDRYPIIVPPTQAPTFMMMLPRLAAAFSNSFWVSRKVV